MYFRNLSRNAYSRVLANDAIWRYGLNFGPTLHYQRSRPALGNEAKRVLNDLNTVGAATTTLEELTGDANLLSRLQEHAEQLKPAKSAEIATKAARLSDDEVLSNGRTDKEFLVTFLDTHRPAITPDGVLANAMLNSQVKGIADTYFGMRTQVADVNIWLNLPGNLPPAASQLWHRDLKQDHFIFKMFIYLEDVLPGSGPFGYLKSTHVKGANRSFSPPVTWDGFNWRATDEHVESLLGEDQILSFPAPAGTVLFADTTGWHRGGRATDQTRLVVQTNFCSRSAFPDRKLGLPAGNDIKDMPWELRYDDSVSAAARQALHTAPAEITD